ncbi:hypothetical protein HPB51_012315 [Rhipicephalus microplus]|uniref:Uncharacterized protein n=1 Tax=Rhipicephalus microplus TaxID=6941 RepID=A0A9J6D9Q3_RHIMP|nr:hypothetical protein HPB51_012315 [Rhipicephalus microplus]
MTERLEDPVAPFFAIYIYGRGGEEALDVPHRRGGSPTSSDTPRGRLYTERTRGRATSSPERRPAINHYLRAAACDAAAVISEVCIARLSSRRQKQRPRTQSKKRRSSRGPAMHTPSALFIGPSSPTLIFLVFFDSTALAPLPKRRVRDLPCSEHSWAGSRSAAAALFCAARNAPQHAGSTELPLARPSAKHMDAQKAKPPRGEPLTIHGFIRRSQRF